MVGRALVGPVWMQARQADGKTGQEILNATARGSDTPGNGWEQLPPLPEIIDGVNQFTRHSFQLGFIPKEQFRQRLLNDHSSVSAFLVVSILSISARLSRPLSARYGSGIKASEFFIERATNLALGEIYPTKNTLENCQAFLLLSIAQEGNGLRDDSHMSMCLALQIASAIKLHLEQTYAYETSNPTPDTIILRESARRTLLQSSPSSPVSLVASDITTLLPCDEDDFANGREPPSRASFEGTRPAIKNPDLVNENRSLFESLIQAYGFWGIVKRHEVNHLSNSYPWDPESEFAKVLKKLDHWEMSLPPAHKWSEARLREHKTKAQDLTHRQPPWGMPPDQIFDLNQGGPQTRNMADCGVVLGGFHPTHVGHYLQTPQDNPLLVADMSMAMGISMESALGDFSGDMTHPRMTPQSWSLLNNDFGGH
ncbi:general repressor of transcription [Fusarium bulbicola]|nr:general repressor of transcription [Fusarium bulbicola]